MAIHGVNPKCYILALFVRDDGARFLLGDDPFEFKDNQLHFQQNTMANDVVEVQGNDGYLLAGQVRRPGTQVFDGYVCNGTNSKEEVEVKRRSFLQFFRRSHFYKVIYVFPNGTAIQRKQGFLVDDPTVQELYQQYPEYHVALNFEDVNYYTYEEDDQGHEIYAKEAIVSLARGGATGGLIWDSYGVVWEDPWSLPLSISGVQFQILNNAGARAPIDNVELYGDTYQQTYSGKNLFSTSVIIGGWSASGSAINSGSRFKSSGKISVSPETTYTFSGIPKDASKTLNIAIQNYDSNDTVISQLPSSTAFADVPFTFTTPANCTKITFFGRYSDNTNFGTVGQPTDAIQEIQIEVGPSATSYEPYTGGIPAPNPDYPQAVQVVTGEQTVDVTEKNIVRIGSYDISGGNYTLKANYGNIKLTSTSAINAFDLNAGTRTGGYLPSYGQANDYHLTGLGGTYTVSVQNFVNRSSGSGNVILQTFTNKRTNGRTITTTATSVMPVTISLDDDEYIKSIYIWTPSSSTIDMEMDIQLEEGSATAYEPYQSQSYTISLTGKNLLDSLDGYIDGYISSSGTIGVGGGVNALFDYMSVDSSSTYTLSASETTRMSFAYFDETRTLISRDANIDNNKQTITTPANCKYVRVWVYRTLSAGGITQSYLESLELQFEKGSQATPYTPYYNYELCKIGDYQDYIYKSGDDWYVHKMLGKAILTGSEAWVEHSQIHNNIHGFRLDIGTVASDGTGVLADRFRAVSWSSYQAEGADGRAYGTITTLSSSGPYIYISQPNASISTLLDFESWLSTHNTTVYYALATPTDTKITDTTLVGQLNALGAMKLFIGENNVLVSATEPNLPATLAFDYYTKFTAIGAEWEEGGTKGATIVNVDAIDNTYPVWELTGPATNLTLSVLTTNTALTYNGTITASQKLVIDMFNKTATLNGTSVIGNISGDFVYMAPGTNRVAYTAGNTDAPDSTIYWQEVVG